MGEGTTNEIERAQSYPPTKINRFKADKFKSEMKLWLSLSPQSLFARVNTTGSRAQPT